MFEFNLFKRNGVRTHGRLVSLPLALLAAAVPAIWLGGCLATHRPAWFMRRSTAERIKEDVRDQFNHLKRKRAKGFFRFTKH